MLDAFHHRVEPPADPQSPAPYTVLALHGTGGDEHSLIPFLRRVAPEAHILSLRGRSNEEGVNRFFRRYDAIRYDQAHIGQEAEAIARFTAAATRHYGLPNPIVALGYSNGANMGLATAILHPEAVGDLVLLRPVMPLERPPEVDLTGRGALVLLGTEDPYRPYADAAVAYLRAQGAEVEVHDWVGAGHQLTRDDQRVVGEWLRTRPNRSNAPTAPING